MQFTTKIAIAVADDLAVWQKMNVVAFLTTGVVAEAGESLIGEPYVDGSGRSYSPLCIQPIVVLKADREKLPTFLARADRRRVKAAVYIDEMFATGHDAANRETVRNHSTESLPLVGIAVRADRKEVDKIFKGARLHD